MSIGEHHVVIVAGLPRIVSVDKRMPDEVNLKIAKQSKVIAFECGCYAEFPTIGYFAGLGWHLMTCVAHHDCRDDIEHALAKCD